MQKSSSHEDHVNITKEDLESEWRIEADDSVHHDVWRVVPLSAAKRMRDLGTTARPHYVATFYSLEAAQECVEAHSSKLRKKKASREHKEAEFRKLGIKIGCVEDAVAAMETVHGKVTLGKKKENRFPSWRFSAEDGAKGSIHCGTDGVCRPDHTWFVWLTEGEMVLDVLQSIRSRGLFIDSPPFKAVFSETYFPAAPGLLDGREV